MCSSEQSLRRRDYAFYLPLEHEQLLAAVGEDRGAFFDFCPLRANEASVRIERASHVIDGAIYLLVRLCFERASQLRAQAFSLCAEFFNGPPPLVWEDEEARGKKHCRSRHARHVERDCRE